MRGGGGKSGDVQQRAAADGDEIRMAINVVSVKVRQNVGDDADGIFGAFAAAYRQWWADEFQAGGVRGKIFFNARFQFRQRLGERFFKDDKGFARGYVGEGIAQSQIGRRKNVLGEEDAQRPSDLNLAFDDGHTFNLNAWRFFTRINLRAFGRLDGNSHAVE